MAGAGFDLSRFLTWPVLGIVRGADEACLAGVLDALVEGGLTHIEITLNTANALGLLSQAAKRLSAGVCLGAGTVRNRADAARALDAGARFIVAPTLDGDVAGFCRERSVAYFPGALTPTEIEEALHLLLQIHEKGITIITYNTALESDIPASFVESDQFDL